jgi:hypothetical protein
VVKKISIEERSNKFNILWEKLKPVYKDQLDRDRSSLQKTIGEYEKYFQPTTFEIMGKQYQEEVHSNVLEYLIENKNGGHQFLLSMINKASVECDKNIVKAIRRKDYSVTREYPLDGQRVDLMIHSKDFYIAIENKVHAKLHDVDEDQEQTQFYRKHLKKHFPYKKSILILLDYKDEERSDHYLRLNYDDLLAILSECNGSFINNRVFHEYALLLVRLLNEIEEISINDIPSLTLSKTQLILKEIKHGSFRSVAGF